MRRRLIVLGAAVALMVAAGPAAMGRLALWAGWADLAVPLLSDPAARGLALYRSGAFAAADTAFAQAGRSQTFNRALTLAATGRYELSVAYFDAVLFSNPGDAEARRLRDLVAARVEPVRGDSIAPGRLTGHGGLSTTTPSPSDLAQAGTPDPERQKRVTARGLAANDDWLRTIGDDPGEFLRLKLEAEHERRTRLGLIRPQEANPW